MFLAHQEHGDLQHHRVLADPSRRRLLDLLRREGPADVQSLAAATGLHVTTVRSHLQQLIAEGLASAASSTSAGRGRPRMVYTASLMTGDDDGRWLADALVDGLAAANSGPDIAEAAGFGWGRQLARQQAVAAGDGPDSLVAMLDRFGFAPRRDHPEEVSLHRCPLLDMARRRPEIVCRLHLGVLRGATAGGDVAVSELVPFSASSPCIVRTTRHRPEPRLR